ncbi:MAG: hypothetical protein ACJ70W_02575 [Nitrososphaera sp.]
MTITAGIATIVVISTIGVIGGIGQQQRALASILEDKGPMRKSMNF